uniref:RNA-binding region-containing protein 3 n=1 Tax=Timema monikensis TaxID=170555 RepID=A0A7R9EI38_9NEOP|nr:unnamed protein product [Timema monikensis]
MRYKYNFIRALVLTYAAIGTLTVSSGRAASSRYVHETQATSSLGKIMLRTSVLGVMISRDTLLIRHLPPDLSLEEKEDLLKHFGATHVKCISSKVKKNNITFARFDGEDSAKQALGRLHQLDVLGFPLVVQFARGRSGQDSNLEKKHT